MAPVGEEGAGDVAAGPADTDSPASGGLGTGKSSYVPPHLRNGAAGAGDRMSGGKYERDDLATLRVTNVSFLSYMKWFDNANSLYRSQRWQKNKSSVTCSSGSVGSQESSWLRTEKLGSRKDLRSSAFKTEQMLPKRVRRWMASGLNT